MDIKLNVYQDQAYRFTKTIHLPCTIGRSPRCDIIVGHPLISRQHCEVYEDHGLVMVRDLGSQNGTYFKGATIGRGVVVAYGEEFSIGAVRFVIEKVKGDTSKMTISPDDAESAPVSAKPEDSDELEFTEPEFLADFPPLDLSDEFEDAGLSKDQAKPEEKKTTVSPAASAPASPEQAPKQVPKPADQDPEDALSSLLFDDADNGGGTGFASNDNSGFGKKKDNDDFSDFGDDSPFLSDY